jgi:hypothetical protein
VSKVDNFAMDAASIERKLGKSLRVMPILILVLLALALGTGGFSDSAEPTFAQTFFKWIFTIFIGVVPLIFMALLILIERLRSSAAKNLRDKSKKLSYQDPFDLPSEELHGYKITVLTGTVPTFTGLTGDHYTSDDVAHCSLNPEHVPPVADCECGFYAYKDIKSAQHELSINPGSFLIDVDLFGVGFTYTRGYKAESQVVNFLILPKRCMRCKVFSPKKFVSYFQLGFNLNPHTKWEYRCGICSYNFKSQDCLTPDEMSKLLRVELR